jgi:mRNA interferase RelE/StbE
MTKYSVEISRDAKKFIKRQSLSISKRITSVIKGLATNPRPYGYIKMKGKKDNLYRVRVGIYRITYTIDDGVLVVLVVSVGSRQTVYKTLPS